MADKISSQSATTTLDGKMSVVTCPDESLDLRKMTILWWKQHCEHDNIWDCNGELRTIPQYVLVNVLAAWEYADELVKAGRRPDIPRHAYTVEWRQCKPLMKLSQVELLFDPVKTEADKTAGCDTNHSEAD